MKKVMAAVLLLVLCLSLAACDSSDYKEARAQFDSGDYAAAQSAFEALGDYEDSADMATECRYQLALAELNSGSYETAAAAFTELGAYKDSAEQVSVCNYHLGTAAMESGDWDTAISFFSDSTYSDSAQLLAACEREKGMHENADYAFLEDIVTAVNNRNKMADAGESFSSIVNAELAILGNYAEQSFYDPELGAIAEQYLEGLNTQKEALKLKYSEYQIEWQEGLVLRYEALCALYEQYGLFDGDTEFINIYLAQLEDQQRYLDAFKAIDEDLVTQLDGIVFDYVNEYTMSAPYTNNTDYDFDIWFYFTFYDENGVRVDESQEYFSNIISGDICTLTFYHPGNWSTCEFFWELTVY